MDHKVAKPHEYLLITGPGTHDKKVEKEATILTGQTCTVFDLSPIPYPVNVLAYSSDKLALLLPVTLTVGPRLENKQSLLKYATLLTPHNYTVSNYVQAAIEGQTRVLAASMKINDIFNNFEGFKNKLFGKLKSELNLFGMVIYIADFKDIKQLSDKEMVDLKGKFGLQDEVDPETLTKLKKLYSEFYNKVYDSAAELYRKQKLAEADLYIQEKVAETARNIQRRAAEAELYIQGKAAESELYIQQRTAETALKIQAMEAEAELYRKEKEAETELYIQQKTAQTELYVKQLEDEGIAAISEAQVRYLQGILDALGGDYAATADYIMLNKEVVNVEKFNPGVVSGFFAKMNIQADAGDVAVGEISDGAVVKDVGEINDGAVSRDDKLPYP